MERIQAKIVTKHFRKNIRFGKINFCSSPPSLPNVDIKHLVLLNKNILFKNMPQKRLNTYESPDLKQTKTREISQFTLAPFRRHTPLNHRVSLRHKAYQSWNVAICCCSSPSCTSLGMERLGWMEKKTQQQDFRDVWVAFFCHLFSSRERMLGAKGL